MIALVQLKSVVEDGYILPESITKGYEEDQANRKRDSNHLSPDNAVEQLIDHKISAIMSASKANKTSTIKARARVGNENELDHKGELGTGSFGRVVKMQHKPSGDMYAVKWINIDNAKRKNVNENDIIRESKIIQSISHVNIARLYDFFHDSTKQHYLLLMELCEGQDLSAFVTAEPPVSSLHLLSWLQQLVEGLVYLHGRDILHRDMKPDNVRVLTNDQIKIIDFGLSRELSDAVKSASTVGIGTSNYSSDEKARPGGVYDGRDDVWAVGCIFLELVTGWRLSFRLSDPSKSAQLAELLHTCQERNAQVARYVRSCLTIDYESRPSSASLCFDIEQERSKTASSNSLSSKVLYE